MKAAECLYTRKVDPAILCRLLEQERCGELMHEIGLYLDETMASGIAAQNQLFNSLSNLLNEHAAEHPEDKQAADAAAQTVLAMRRPLYTERDRIRSDFDQLLMDIKKDSPSNAKRAAMFTKDTMKNMSVKLKKGANRFTLGRVSPESLVNSILGQLDMTDAPESVKPEMDRVVARLREDLTDYFSILNAAKEQIG